MSTALQQVAKRLAVSEQELQGIVMSTVMPNGGQRVTEAQFISFIAVANEYKLNPLTKEIYAFPAKGGGIQPIVSIDGWLRIINTHPDFNGMTFKDERDERGNLISITCLIYKKEIEHPVQVTEYIDECKMNTEPWKKYPARMLRHKAAIQAGRYAFGLSGIIDPDEADRYKEAGAIVEEKVVEAEVVLPEYTAEQFEQNFPKWKDAVEAGKSTPDQIIATVVSRFALSDNQKDQIQGLK